MGTVVQPSNRVVITGIGLVTPLGTNRESSWQRIQQGDCATRWLNSAELPLSVDDRKQFNRAGLFAGAPAFNPKALHREGKTYDPVVSMALNSAEEAIADADLDWATLNRERFGCVVGTSKGGLRSFAKASQAIKSNSDQVDIGQLWNQFQPNAAVSTLSAQFDLRGPALCPVAACATGLTCLVRAAELIRDGHCDTVLAGSSDASLQEAVLSSFNRMGVLASGFDDATEACRPFDRQRNGFLIGEGAAIFVLERLDNALARGKTPYAEWVTGGMASDITGLTHLDQQSSSLSWLISDVLRRSELTSSEIDYVNLHGTATVMNDLCETRAVKTALGPSAARVSCSSLKGAMGHLLGAAGSVELAATALAIRDRVIPPTVNLQEPDSECDLNYTAIQPQTRRIENALKLSLGFGGHLVAAVIREFQA
jgi:3-oxoacyl-[acyl-carrier-protein] synthase II